ncbi:RHS repeat domain-containing protein [Shewanella sp. KX20019]|uniref:RHS repeat domain-containing protein n=1 Tax=Shewanella sp. KX20019 TaxID=2803864 RepID=UPI003FA6D094
MNGRVYDYNMGRFMSVDPLIQRPTSTQSVNPYSYIMNNPLSGTDPTGYAAEDETMTGSRIKGVYTGAHGAAFGARAEMGRKNKSDSGANKSQSTQNTDVKANEIGSHENKLKHIQIVERDETGSISRDENGKISNGNVESLSDEELEFIHKLDSLIEDYRIAISNMRNDEAVGEFERTDWFYDPSNPDVQGGVVAVATNVLEGQDTPYGNKSRNPVIFGRRGIAIMNSNTSQTWKYHKQTFHGGKAGMLEVISHEAGHTIQINIWAPSLPGRPPSNHLTGIEMERKANSHMRQIKMGDDYPNWYYENIY